MEEKTSDLQKIFVTGGSSELISSVLDRLPKDKYELICLTRKSNGIERVGLTWLQGDLVSPKTYKGALQNCSVVLHAAAVTHTVNEEEYYQVNLHGTQALVNALGPKTRIIFISSRTASMDSGAYGASKLLAEQFIKQKMTDWLILRPSEIFGGSKSEGIDKAIEAAVSGGFQLCPLGVNTPMYPIHTEDAARLIHEYAFAKQETQMTIHINGPSPYSFKQLIEMVARLSGRPARILPLPKVILQLAALFVKITKVNIGIAPDQVARLYSNKEHDPVSGEFLSIEEYVRSKLV